MDLENVRYPAQQSSRSSSPHPRQISKVRELEVRTDLNLRVYRVSAKSGQGMKYLYGTIVDNRKIGTRYPEETD